MLQRKVWTPNRACRRYHLLCPWIYTCIDIILNLTIVVLKVFFQKSSVQFKGSTILINFILNLFLHFYMKLLIWVNYFPHLVIDYSRQCILSRHGDSPDVLYENWNSWQFFYLQHILCTFILMQCSKYYRERYFVVTRT